MIKVLSKEFIEGGLAVTTTEVTFFNIPIYKTKKTTTNREVIKLLTSINNSTKINGFV